MATAFEMKELQPPFFGLGPTYLELVNINDVDFFALGDVLVLVRGCFPNCNTTLHIELPVARAALCSANQASLTALKVRRTLGGHVQY